MSAVTPGNPADQSEVSIPLPLRQSQLTVVVVRGVEGVLLRGGVVARRGDVPLERPVHAAPIRSEYCDRVTNHSRVLRVSANESSPAGAGPVAVVATVAVWPQTRAQAATEVLRGHG